MHCSFNHLKIPLFLQLATVCHDAAGHFGTRAKVVAARVVLAAKNFLVLERLVPQLDRLFLVDAC